MSSDDVTSPNRNLLQTAFCPEGCAAGSCIQDATKGGLRCQKCVNMLVVDKVSGECACPAGRYSLNGELSCRDCPKGSWCAGAIFRPTTNGALQPSMPVAVACPANMTTLGQRSTSNRACVQLPGFYYTIDNGNPGAVQCPVNTYGPGLKKQRACVPCPTGFTTDLRVQQTMPTACIVPAGYYLKAPGQVAPCPRGEWKAGIGISANCTKCAFGVTTTNEASTSEAECKLLVPGYYAAEVAADGIVKRTQICPQGYYCPGGDPVAAFNPATATIPVGDTTIVKCAGGVWTIELGASAPEQCLTPPGHFTAGGVTSKCPAGFFRAAWKPAAEATSCTACGEGVKADATDRVTQYNILDPTQSTAVNITTSADDCYIMPGQGLYFSTLTNTWRARNCDSNSYGVANKTYGLTPAACRDCPAGQVATLAAPYTVPQRFYSISGTDGGFTSVMACVNMPGYGYNGRVSQKCEVGTWNTGDNYGDCTACGFGLTTEAVGAGVNLTSCGLAAGYGRGPSGIMPCPIGSFNPAPWTAAVAGVFPACTDCPGFTTTQAEGADNERQCNLCDAGYGGSGGSDTTCTTKCGGAVASYGTPGREAGTPCTACSTQATGFSFEWMMNQDTYQSRAVAIDGAASAGECLSEFAQIVDGAWYIEMGPLPGMSQLTAFDTQSPANPVNTNTSANTHAECMSQCVGNCMFATFDYRNKRCLIHWGKPPTYVGSDIVAIKNVASGDVGVSSLENEGKAGAPPVGKFTFWRDEYSQEIKGQSGIIHTVPATGYQDCLNRCDDDVKCAAVIFDIYVQASQRWLNCRKVVGVETVGVFLRTMTRAVTTRQAFPDLSQG